MNYNEWHFSHFAVNFLDSSIIDEILLTNLIFLASKPEVPTVHTKLSFLHARKFNEIAKFVTKQQIDLNFSRRKLYGNQQFILIIESLTDTLNIRIACYYLINLEKLTLSKSNSNMMNIYEKGTLRWHKYFTFRVHNVTPPEKNVLRLPITLLIFIIMLLNLDTIISKIWRVSDVIFTCVHKT